MSLNMPQSGSLHAGLDLVDHARVFEALPIAYALIDRDFRFVDVNALYLATFGAERADLLGRPVFDVFPETDARRRTITEAFDLAFEGTPSVLEELQYSVGSTGSTGETHEYRWYVHICPVPDAAGRIPLIGLRVEDVTAKSRERRLKDAISRELQHRVGNLFTLITTIAKRTAEHAPDLPRFMADFESRILSLSATNKLLTGTNWNGTTFRDLVQRHLSSHAGDMADRITLSGPDLRVTVSEAQPLSMALHELATNAVKYGALGRDGGRLRVEWGAWDGDGFFFDWIEEGLTGVTEPAQLGFGSMILSRILTSQLNGTAERSFADTGHRYRFVVADRIAQTDKALAQPTD